MYAPGGAKYKVVDVRGGGLCGFLAPIALDLFAAGFPVEDIVSAVKDNITDDMKEYVQTSRGKVVEMSRDFYTFLDDVPEYEQTPDGEELADFADVVGNPKWVILTREMWERVMLFPTGYFDGKAIVLMGKVLHMNGLRIAKHANGILAPCDARGPLPKEHCPMVVYDEYGHFKALIPSGEASESEASGGTDGEESAAPDVESDASGGTDGEEPAAPDVESEASGGTD
ncbi:unnamed protein product, partial [Ectocarpus sp. 4 AP-2014]